MGDEYSVVSLSHARRKSQYPYRRLVAVLPVTVAEDIRLSGTAKSLLIIHSGYCDGEGWCWLSQREKADLLHKSKTTVAATLKRLVEMGYLQIERNRYNLRLHVKRRAIYRLHPDVLTLPGPGLAAYG